jgi:hypothetical protein
MIYRQYRIKNQVIGKQFELEALNLVNVPADWYLILPLALKTTEMTGGLDSTAIRRAPFLRPLKEWPEVRDLVPCGNINKDACFQYSKWRLGL